MSTQQSRPAPRDEGAVLPALKGTRTQGLFGATLGFFIGFAAVALFGITASRFQEVMGLSPMLVGFLVAIPSLSGSLLRIPFAAWVDVTGGRKPFLVLLSLSVAGMLGLTLVIHFLYPQHLTRSIYPLLLLLGMLSGCGIATFSVGISQVSYWFPQRMQGKAAGIYGGVGNMAPGLFSLIIPFAIGSLGLAGCYLAWLFFLAIGTVLYALTGRNSYYFQLRSQGLPPDEAKALASEKGQELFPAGGFKLSLRLSANVWKTWALVGIYFTTFGGFIALTAWFPTYWKSYFAFGAIAAGMLTALYSLTTSLVRVAGGVMADKAGGENCLFAALSAMGFAALVMAFSGQVWLSISAALVLAVAMGVGNAAVFKLVPQAVPKAIGGAAGWVGGLGAFGGFAIPPLMSSFVRSMGKAGYSAGFGVFIVMAVVSLALAVLLKRAKVRERHSCLSAPEVSPSTEGQARMPIPQASSETGGTVQLITVVLLVGVVFSAALLVPKLTAIRLPGIQRGYEPAQPIAFSHRLHSGELQVSCLYCHFGAEKSRNAGIPSANVCMNCHKFVTAPVGAVREEESLAKKQGREPRRLVSPELQKLYDAMALDDKMRPDANKVPRPIEWARVHKLPDFAYFDHRAHVRAQVACQQCHGPVESMERMRQISDLTMGWCVNCHRDVNRTGVAGRKVSASIDCSTCHY